MTAQGNLIHTNSTKFFEENILIMIKMKHKMFLLTEPFVRIKIKKLSLKLAFFSKPTIIMSDLDHETVCRQGNEGL